MYTLIETPTFAADAATLWSEDERTAFAVWIAANPLAGVVAPKSGGCRKARWQRAGAGKRGGVRVIYFNWLESAEIWRLAIDAKAVRGSIPAHLRQAIKEAIEHD